MVKMTFASAALIAAIAFTGQAVFASQAFASQALAARNDHRATNARGVAKDCVRAPNVGAYASDPYTIPPCMPNTTADTFH
jgi:hypothetical protein